MTYDSKIMDETGWKILEILQRNARIPFSELGREVGLSAPAAAERVRRMEDAGIITGYRAQVNPERLGYSLEVFIRLLSTGPNHDSATRFIATLPQVLEFWCLTGEDGYVMRAVFRSVKELDNFLHQELKRYGTTTTALVLSKPVDFRVIQEEGRE